MKKIGITGSLASGKTTASKFLSSNRRPLFSADKEVKDLYKNTNFKRKISKKFKIKDKSKIKKILIEKILHNKSNLQKLEKLIHPLVRKKMRRFTQKNRKKKIIFFEIPLLIESKLMKYFDVIIFIKAKKNIRLKRFISKGGNRHLFNLLNKKQLSDVKKIKNSDHVVVNDKNIKILKQNLLAILKNYE